MVATAGHKLVVTSDDVEPQLLHDLVNDPDERQSLVDDRDHAAELAELLDRWVHPFLAGQVS